MAKRRYISNAVEDFDDLVCSVVGRSLTNRGKSVVDKWLSRFSYHQLEVAFETAMDQYYDDSDEDSELRTWKKVWDSIPKIAHINQRGYNDEQKRLFYIRGILRNRVQIDEAEAIKLLFDMYEADVHVEDIESLAKRVTSWEQFVHFAIDYIRDERSY